MSLPVRETARLETPRLILRPRRVEDADALHASYADPDLMTYWSGPPHTDIEQTRADFVRHASDWRAWAITLRGDDSAIGVVAAGEKRQGNVSELGYLLARTHWRTGIAREAVSAVIDRIFAEGQRRVFADTDSDNSSSRALLERLGFTLEGHLRGEWETHLGVRDSVIYGLLREEWNATAA
ncbi:GNAT family protein [Sphingomonas sp.]|uniref:GNAT family N-acetyltransferase n=1 Tax=Sphingomonas sp. TaxID=28214 RepID=UPI0025D688F6|nr:GNAT family protein [Sphingomonas sp.]